MAVLGTFTDMTRSESVTAKTLRNTARIFYNPDLISESDARNIGKPGKAIPVNWSNLATPMYSANAIVTFVDGHYEPPVTRPTNCGNCGAGLRSNLCAYCRTEYGGY